MGDKRNATLPGDVGSNPILDQFMGYLDSRQKLAESIDMEEVDHIGYIIRYGTAKCSEAAAEVARCYTDEQLDYIDRLMVEKVFSLMTRIEEWGKDKELALSLAAEREELENLCGFMWVARVGRKWRFMAEVRCLDRIGEEHSHLQQSLKSMWDNDFLSEVSCHNPMAWWGNM